MCKRFMKEIYSQISVWLSKHLCNHNNEGQVKFKAELRLDDYVKKKNNNNNVLEPGIIKLY